MLESLESWAYTCPVCGTELSLVTFNLSQSLPCPWGWQLHHAGLFFRTRKKNLPCPQNVHYVSCFHRRAFSRLWFYAFPIWICSIFFNVPRRSSSHLFFYAMLGLCNASLVQLEKLLSVPQVNWNILENSEHLAHWEFVEQERIWMAAIHCGFILLGTCRYSRPLMIVNQ